MCQIYLASLKMQLGELIKALRWLGSDHGNQL